MIWEFSLIWLADWLAYWLTERCTDWLTGWLWDALTSLLADCKMHWLVNWLTERCTDWLAYLLTHKLTYTLISQLTDWLTDSLTHSLTHSLRARLASWPTKWLTSCLVGWPIERLDFALKSQALRPGYLVPSQILYVYLAPSKSPQNLGHCWPGVVLQGGIGHIGHFLAQSLFHNPIHQITIDFDFVFFLLHISSDYILVCWPHWIALRVVGLQFFMS